MTVPLISAIICTHNREQYLGAAIDSLLAQTLDCYEIIVVDNASTDATAAIAQSRVDSAANNAASTLLTLKFATFTSQRWVCLLPVTEGLKKLRAKF